LKMFMPSRVQFHAVSTGPNTMVYTLPAGLFDRSKSATMTEAAVAELSEEAHLTGGKWVPLVEDGSEGIVELKWCKVMYLHRIVDFVGFTNLLAESIHSLLSHREPLWLKSIL